MKQSPPNSHTRDPQRPESAAASRDPVLTHPDVQAGERAGRPGVCGYSVGTDYAH